MPAATDKFKKVGNPGTATTLSAPGYTVGATSLTVASTTNHPTDTGVCVSMYEVTTVGTQTVMTPGSYNEYNGVVSGATSITSLSHVAGSGTDRNYAAGTGTVVTIMVSSGRENDLIDGLLVSHNQDGTLKTGSVTTLAITDASVTTAKLADANVTEAKLADNAVTTAKITDASVTNTKLSTSAILLGYAQTTSTFTTSSTTAAQVTGLSSTVTIPAGGRKVKITCHVQDVGTNTGGATVLLSIWDGTVGSGTQLAATRNTSTVHSALHAAQVISVVTPSAGNKTYNIGLQTDNSLNAAFIEASATSPAFILVELI